MTTAQTLAVVHVALVGQACAADANVTVLQAVPAPAMPVGEGPGSLALSTTCMAAGVNIRRSLIRHQHHMLAQS